MRSGWLGLASSRGIIILYTEENNNHCEHPSPPTNSPRLPQLAIHILDKQLSDPALPDGMLSIQTDKLSPDPLQLRHRHTPRRQLQHLLHHQ